MNIGLKTGVVTLLPHQVEWEINAEETIILMRTILGDACIDIQHVGSTSIKHICAKPIIDIAVAVNVLADILPYNDMLANNGIYYRKEEATGQLLYLMGDLDNKIKTHHIHVVKHNSVNWRNYLNFRDYLNEFPEKAKLYNDLKQELAEKYTFERKLYTAGKKDTIENLLKEAEEWRNKMNRGLAMKSIQLVLAKAGDENLIHTMKYNSFLPLYARYQDEETNPVKELISKVASQLKSDATDYYIIHFNSQPVGAVRVVNDGIENGEQIYRISPLFVIPEHQNKGIGYIVVNMIFDKYENADKWRLSTIKQEQGNCRLYEKCGFKLVGDEQIINDRMTIVYYEKEVKS